MIFKIIDSPEIQSYLEDGEICIKYSDEQLYARKYIYSNFGTITVKERKLPILLKIELEEKSKRIKLTTITKEKNTCKENAIIRI